MRRILCLFAALLLSAIAGAAEEHPWTNKRIYYVVEQDGVLAAKGFFVRRGGSYQRRFCWVIEEERALFTPANPGVPWRVVRIRTSMTPDGVALHRIETAFPEGAGQESVLIAGGAAVFESSGVYGRSGSLPLSDPVYFDVTGDLLAGLPGRAGAVHTVPVLDRVAKAPVQTEIALRGQETGEDGEPVPGVFLADIVTPGRESRTAWYTPDGRLMRIEGGGMAYQVVPRDAYERGRIPPRTYETVTREPLNITFFRPGRPIEPPPPAGGVAAQPPPTPTEWTGTGGYSPAPSAPRAGARIPVGESIPAWDSFARLLLDAAPAYEWNNALSSSEYAQIDTNGVSAGISALRNAPVVDPRITFPMNIPPDIMPYMLSSELVPSDHRAVVEAAYAAVLDSGGEREERSVLRAVSFLAGWVNQSVAVDSWRGYDSSALTTLAERRGDSLGHARLFSAMARTLGVPTRLCQGFLVRSGDAVHHCWAEVWVYGVWVPVDTTVSRVGLPAGYVLAERGQGNGEFRFDFVEFLRSPGLSLRLVAAGRETPSGGRAELVVGDRRTYAFSEGDWLTNLYWGYAMRLPQRWNGRALLNSVELSSPDGLASIRCEALEGDFGAGAAELRQTEESLRTSLVNYRTIEARVVSFDADGATPALFLDFTCIEDGDRLRCRQYVVPRRERAFRLSFWAPVDDFREYSPDFDSVLASVEF